MAIDTKHHELQGLRIDRSDRGEGGQPSSWAGRYIIVGVSVVVLLSLAALAYRLFAGDVSEVEVARATTESSNNPAGAVVLSATGYIVAHHKIEANSKVTGRVAWIGVEKGDRVKEGQVLILDSGTTTTAIARALRKFQNLTIITNAVNIAAERKVECDRAVHTLHDIVAYRVA